MRRIRFSAVGTDIRTTRFPRYAKQLQLEEGTGLGELVVLIHKQQCACGVVKCVEVCLFNAVNVMAFVVDFGCRCERQGCGLVLVRFAKARAATGEAVNRLNLSWVDREPIQRAG